MESEAEEVTANADISAARETTRRSAVDMASVHPGNGADILILQSRLSSIDTVVKVLRRALYSKCSQLKCSPL